MLFCCVTWYDNSIQSLRQATPADNPLMKVTSANGTVDQPDSINPSPKIDPFDPTERDPSRSSAAESVDHIEDVEVIE